MFCVRPTKTSMLRTSADLQNGDNAVLNWKGIKLMLKSNVIVRSDLLL